MPCWRLIISKIATKKELDTHWGIDDILKANSILDFKDEMMRLLFPKKPKGV